MTTQMTPAISKLEVATVEETFPKFHPVQWQIIKKMSLLPEPHFNEIKPPTMDPKRFTYHLNKLRDLDLIRHDQDKQVYLLTDKAKALMGYFIDIPSWGTLPLNSAILLYVLRDSKILVVKRDKQPFLNFTGLPYFYTRQEEFVHQSAKRALASLGLQGQLSLRLIIEVLFKNNKEEVIRHAFMLTYFCQSPRGLLHKTSYEGNLSWLSPVDLLTTSPGYDNTRDIVNFFTKGRPAKGATVVSKTYHTPW